MRHPRLSRGVSRTDVFTGLIHTRDDRERQKNPLTWGVGEVRIKAEHMS